MAWVPKFTPSGGDIGLAYAGRPKYDYLFFAIPEKPKPGKFELHAQLKRRGLKH